MSINVSEKTSTLWPGHTVQWRESLLPGITECNVIGPHIYWGSWRAEAATVHRPTHTWPGPLVELVIGSRNSCSHDAQCLIVLEIKFPQQAEKKTQEERAFGLMDKLCLSRVQLYTNTAKSQNSVTSWELKSLYKQEKLRRKNNLNQELCQHPKQMCEKLK